MLGVMGAHWRGAGVGTAGKRAVDGDFGLRVARGTFVEYVEGGGRSGGRVDESFVIATI